MLSRLRPYPAYKVTEASWLGAIPATWPVMPNRALFEERRDRERPNEAMLSVTIGRGVIRQDELLENSAKKDSSNVDKSKYKLVCPGDIAYNKMRAWQGAIGVSRYRGIVSPAYVVVRGRGEIVPEYFHYLLRTSAFASEAERWSYGISSDQWSLRPEEFRQIYSCVPTLAEQLAIVRFLDHADRKIRKFIRAKQKLIKLLEEQKQAIIHQAVTRGLDPNVKLKPSGVEWLGDAPEHWTIGRIKTEFTNLNTRRIPLSGTQRGAMTRRQYDYYGASGVIDRVDDFIFDDELILIAEDGANLVLRNLPLAIIARGKFWVNNHAHILKPRWGSLEYLAALLECMEFSPWITGAAQPKLTQDRLMAVRIPVPPATEQVAIMEWLKANTATLDAAVRKGRSEMALLNELRTRLIADVVTGKLDVREAAAALPEVTEEPDEDADHIDESVDEEAEELAEAEEIEE